METLNTTHYEGYRYKDYGILVIRVGTGLLLLIQMFLELFSEKAAFNLFGIDQHGESSFFAFTLGMLVTFAYFIAVILLMLGYFTRRAAAFLSIATVVTIAYSFSEGVKFIDSIKSIHFFIVSLAMIFLGPGKISMDVKTSHDKITLT